MTDQTDRAIAQTDRAIAEAQEAIEGWAKAQAEVDRLRRHVFRLRRCIECLNPRTGEWITPGSELASMIDNVMEETK